MARTLRTSSRRLLTETLRSVPSEFVEEFDTWDLWCELDFLDRFMSSSSTSLSPSSPSPSHAASSHLSP
ncbi:hypothetical protein QJS04_geneDACA024343 [Acorus gramineus]|uniref:Uncharacterized protein n=1 Tax=Acorus gramineus TaxID=55184 RepID=A0AAV9A0K6_ACOGR|nr:hypothetical protein QJS04_geneDACA024343 [Acorus gramineus]